MPTPVIAEPKNTGYAGGAPGPLDEPAAQLRVGHGSVGEVAGQQAVVTRGEKLGQRLDVVPVVGAEQTDRRRPRT